MKPAESQSTFVTALITEHAPEEVLQLGLGDVNLTLSVCQALERLENSALTLITPTIAQHASFLKELKKQEATSLGNLVELIRTPADEVLPDFYFQNRSVDLAIINDTAPFDQALVALYYVDKMLVSRGTVVINNATHPVMRKICRYLLTERDYTLQKSLDAATRQPLLARFLRSQFNRAPDFIKGTVKNVIHPDLLMTDDDLGLQCSVVALTKPTVEGEIDMDFDTLLASIMDENSSNP
ncbi:class I SAM-dependent methyltransferase [Marinobacter sp. SS21]|uniref:class I SAM-dependent methyltransferase n=1 Tax=Marinobacter sp. SS21 TaxID=2979460 RepID=UPI00232D0B95|nr:class I SAM-dependent methyltransferase [Marinobacter sp. SS21]MDC0663545.1 hypothetical protein [Marinobacter sp. SS21]